MYRQALATAAEARGCGGACRYRALRFPLMLRIYLLLYVCAALSCSIVSYGDLATIDARIMLDAARHAGSGAGFTVDPAIGIPGNGGLFYSGYGPANSLLMLPLVFAARMITSVLPLTLPISFVEEFLCAMTSAWLKALGVVLVLLILQRFDDDPRRNVLAALGMMFVGFDFQYGRSYFAEVPVATCLLAATLALVSCDVAYYRRGFVMGCALALAMAFRWELALFVPMFAVMAWRQRPPSVLLAVAAFALPIAVAAIGLGIYNEMRFGAFWRTGYERLPLPAWPVLGWLGIVLAPGAGLLWFAPWSATLVVLPRLDTKGDRRLRDLLKGVVVLVGMACLFYGSWGWWTGGVAWGPRFLTPFVPLLTVVCVLVWRMHTAARRVGMTLAAACVVMNGLLLIAPHERLRAYAEVQGWTETERVWSPSRSPWAQQPLMAMQVARQLPRIGDLAPRARERAVIRSQPRSPEAIDAADALQSSVTLNVPAIWWIRLVVIGLPPWLAAVIGLFACATLAVLLRLLISLLPRRVEP